MSLIYGQKKDSITTIVHYISSVYQHIKSIHITLIIVRGQTSSVKCLFLDIRIFSCPHFDDQNKNLNSYHVIYLYRDSYMLHLCDLTDDITENVLNWVKQVFGISYRVFDSPEHNLQVDYRILPVWHGTQRHHSRTYSLN